jgi:hypothetical protein
MNLTSPGPAVLLVTGLVAIAAGGALVAVAPWHHGASHAGSPASLVAPKRAFPPLPAASGKAMLTIRGVTHGNSGPGVTRLDFAGVDNVAREHVVVFEPFLKRDIHYTGIRLGELLKRAGGASAGSTIVFHALDDYSVTLPLAKIASDVIVATRSNGKRLPIADGGPIRMLYTRSSKVADNTDNWIWSIDSMRLTP